MEIIKVSNYKELSKYLANEVLSNMMSSSEKYICLPSGDTPLGAFQTISENLSHKDVDLLKFKLVGLDEWVGMGRETEGSCQYYLNKFLYRPSNIPDEKMIEFNAKQSDLAYECEKMDQLLKEHGPLDLVVLGIGMNGHLGLNEPGTSFDLYSHVIPLSETTKTVAQKYFSETVNLDKGITLGIKHFLEAKRLILVASGKQKAQIVKEIVESEISEALPASMVKLHQNSIVLIDEDAANQL